MPNQGKAFVQGLAYVTSDPSALAVAAFDVPPGTLVLDTTNGVLYQKVAALGTNTAGYILYRSNTPGAVGASETKFCTTEFVAVTGTTGATLTDVVGLTGFTMTAAGIYKFDVHLATVGTTNSGVKAGFGYTTTTATSIESTAVGAAAAAIVTQHTTTSTTGMTLYGSTTATLGVRITGRLIVNAGGTLAIQAAQNAAHADETKVLVGSWGTFTRVS